MFKKNVLPVLGVAAAYAGLSPLLAYAEVNLNPCPNGTTGDFSQLCVTDKNQISDVLLRAIVAVLIIAAVIALAFLIWGGIKWITSGGDKAKVEAARSTIIAAIIGLIIAFLAFFILNLVLGLFGLNIHSLQIPSIIR